MEDWFRLRPDGKPYTKSALVQAARVLNGVFGDTSDICVMCLSEIKIQIFKGTGVCCEAHRKLRDKDTGVTKMTVDAPMTGRN